MASEITEGGGRLFDLLTREPELREARDKALSFLNNLSGSLDSTAEQDYIRRCIKDVVQNQESSLSQMGKMLEDLEKDEKALETKLKKRSVELERAEKRMKSLQTVRPAFMDEYDRIEQDLQQVYEYFVLKHKNLSYLEHDLEQYSRLEEQRKEQASKALDAERERIKEDELRLLKGGSELDTFDRNLMADAMHRERPMEARPHNRQAVQQHAGSEDSDLIDDDDDGSELEVDEDDSESSNEDF